MSNQLNPLLKFMREADYRLGRLEAKQGKKSSKATPLTISVGAITVAFRDFYTLLPETGTVDDLVTIFGGEDGYFVTFTTETVGHTVTLKNGTGNLALNGDCILTDPTQTITLRYSNAQSKWLEVARTNTAGGGGSGSLTTHVGLDYIEGHDTSSPAVNKNGTYFSFNFGIIGGSGTDVSSALSAMIETVGAAGGGRIVVRAASGADVIRLDKIVSIYYDNIDIQFLSPVIIGLEGGCRVMGAMDEFVRPPATNAASLHTSHPALEGDTTIFLSATGGKMQASDFLDGDLVTIRGENDASGKALQKQIITILSRDTGANTITFAEALEFDFDPTYPSSAWVPDHTTGTTIYVNRACAFTGNVARGTMSTEVLNIANIAVGDMVRCYDSRVEIDLNAAAIRSSGLPYENECRLEYRTVTKIVPDGIDPTKGIVTFDLPISKDYLAGSPYFGGIAKVLPVKNSHIRDMKVTFHADQTTRNFHTSSINFSKDCTIENCNVNGLNGAKGQMYRISDSINGWVKHCIGENPKYHESSEGYIGANYKSDRSGFFDCTFRGGRHNYLMQASTNWTVQSCRSYDAWISGIDAHGVDEYDGLISDCMLSQMNNHTMDAANGACMRIGNTSHTVGTHWTTIQGCTFYGNHDANIAGLDFLAASTHLTINGCKFYGGSYGIKSSKNPSQCTPTQTTSQITIFNCEFYNIATRPIFLEGVPDTAAGTRSSGKIDNVIIEACKDWNCAQHVQITGGNAITNVTVEGYTIKQPVNTSTNYALVATSVDGLMVAKNVYHGAKRGISLTNCTNAAVIFNTLTATVDAIPFNDGGGNTGPGGGALYYVGNVVDNSSIASGSTAFATNVSVTNAQPEYLWNETDATTDEKQWRAVTAAGDWYLQLLTDLGVAVTNAILVQRAGTAVSAITLAGPTTITGALTLSGGITGTLAGYILSNGTIPLTADWDTGVGRRILNRIIQARDSNGLGIYEDSGNFGLNILDTGDVTGSTGKYIAFRTFRALDANGLSLLEDSGTSGLHVLDSGNVTGTAGKYLAIRTLRALDANGLDLCDDAGNLAIYIEDATGAVGFGTGSPASGVRITTDGEARFRQAGNTRYYGSIVPSGAIVTFTTWDSTLGAYIPMHLNASTLVTNANLGAWTGVTFSGTWANIGGSDSACRYRKFGDIVYVEGVAVRSGTSGLSAFTLPLGFRPALHKWFFCGVKYGGTFRLCRVEIATSGLVTITDPTEPGVAITFLMLDGIQFSTT